MRIIMHMLILIVVMALAGPGFTQDAPLGAGPDMAALEAEHGEIEQLLVDYNTEFERLLGLGYGGEALRHDLTNLADNVGTLQSRLADIAAQMAQLKKAADVNPIEPFDIVIRRGAQDGPATRRIAAGEMVFFVVDLPYPKLGEDMRSTLTWTLTVPDGSTSKDVFKSENVVRDGERGTHVFGVSTGDLPDGAYSIHAQHQEVGAPEHKQVATENFTIKTPRVLAITSVLVDDEKTGDAHKSVLAKDTIPYLFINFTASKNIAAITAHLSVVDETTGVQVFQKTGRRVIRPDMDAQFIHVGLNPAKYPLSDGHSYRFNVRLEDNLNASDNEFYKPEILTSQSSVAFRYGAAAQEETENDTDVVDEIDLDGETTEPNMNTLEVGGGDGGESEWDKIPADQETTGADNTVIADASDDAPADDGWDAADEVDDVVVGASEDQINAVRDRMAAQAANDQSRISANARNDFARIEAEREERARQKAEARARFAAAMQELAVGINEAYTKAKNESSPTDVYSGRTTSSTPYTPRTPSPVRSGARQDNTWKLIKACKERKYAAARASGFPIMDPMGPELECRREIAGGGSGGNNRSFSQGSGSQNSGADQCTALAKGSKNPKRWGACCRKGGEMRYNAFTTPDGSRTGLSAYRCMQKGQPDEPRYMLDID